MTLLSPVSARSRLFALALLWACGDDEGPADDGGAVLDGGLADDGGARDADTTAGDAGSGADARPESDADGQGTGALCGGFAGFACAAGEFCDFAAGTGCEGVADASGACTTLPEACAELYAPVCGCDHRTYENACSANAAGVSVMRDGMCTAEDCDLLGGRTVTSDGASTPACAAGERGFRIPGRELALCCTSD